MVYMNNGILFKHKNKKILEYTAAKKKLENETLSKLGA